MSINVHRCHIFIAGLIIVHFFPMFLLPMADDAVINIAISENIPIGTVICKLSDKIIPRPMKNTEFSIPKNPFFAIDNRDHLAVIGTIDRDANLRLCLNKNSTFSCIWKSFILSTNGIYYILQIFVADENDNAPHWEQNSFTIEVVENTPVDSFHLELPKAKDLDEYPNHVDYYKIDPDSKYFTIYSIRTEAGIKPFLKLKRTVDRELVSWHNITILAIDGGKPAQTGTLVLFIKILDVNDNSPVFESSIYTHHMGYNIDINSVLDLKIRATDLDIDSNGNITYQFSVDVPFIIQSCFKIDPVNAVIRIKKSLVQECYAPEYRFSITATDHGNPTKMSKTSVILHLKNQNLYPPNITLSNNDPNIRLPENNDVGILLISGAVKDKDSGENGEFSCNLRGANKSEIVLKLNKTQIEDTTIISLVTNHTFDREKTSKLYLSIVCQDFGNPPLQSHVNIFLTILDINDNEPVFERTFNHITIYEEKSPNYEIGQLTAHDRDSGENARLQYRMKWDQHKYNITELIEVDWVGRIIARRSLDRETYPDGFKFQIIATDHGHPPKSSSTNVYLELLDMNDHSPVFEKPFYNLSFMEDSGLKQQRRIVENILAFDADLMENGVVSYSLVSDSLLPFKLNPNTGELYSFILVDRETQPTYYSFSIIATDNPSNLLYRRTTTVLVSVLIEDFNDHEPVFIFPNESHHKVELSYLVPMGTIVTTVKALDKDFGSNSQMVYSLVDAERNILFAINESSGDLTTSTVLNAIHEGVENLFIKASDCGTPPLKAIHRLTIIVGEFRTADSTNSNDDDTHRESFLSDQATFIIVGIILGTFLICCGLVTGICTMAYRHRNHTQNRSTTTQLYQVGEELNNVQYIDNYLMMKEIS